MLLVFHDTTLAGRLWQENRVLHFSYESEWQKSANGLDLSPRLPLGSGVLSGDDVLSFFAGLLPEGPVLSALLKFKRLPEGDVYSQLEAFGEEAAGAFAIVRDERQFHRAPEYIPYEPDQIRADLERLRENQPLLGLHGELRLSLAGAQNKIPVKWEDGQFFLPAGGAPSTHILKPALQPERMFPHSVWNEAFCLALARKCGLDAVGAEIVQLPEPVMVTSRYDRVISDGRITRLHQLDFCQIAGLLPDQKYEQHGGPSFPQIMKMLDDHAMVPAADRIRALDWLVFNYLVGNGNAHARNLAMLCGPGGNLALAPFYDILCTAVYPEFDPRMAMSIGGEFRPDWVMQRHRERFAADAGVNLALFSRRAHALAERAVSEFDNVAGAMELDVSTEFVARVRNVVHQRAKWLGSAPK
ncbi:MAG: type II toxin-antitoxin system HipA family toxin [Candidatus Sumerlaeaceae bacterium]|nr:type II toxin-antitoxin system HipA family toxin [Candidatus Sumerlaeaceae bacterium]